MNFESVFNFLTDTSTTSRRVALTILMLFCWLLSIILGVVTIVVLSDWVVFLFTRTIDPGDSVVERSGQIVSARYAIFVLGGIGWIVLTIMGFEGVKQIANKRAWRTILWVLLVEILIVLSAVIFLP
jgi:hypothetical protein